MDILVRQAGMDDQKIIWDFIKIAYKNTCEYKFPDRWNWEFKNNPFVDDGLLPVWIAIEGNKVIGQTCAMYVLLKVKNKIYKAAWSVDTIVLPEYQGKGIGKRLQKSNSVANKIFMSLSMSDKNRNIKKGLGSVQLEPVTVFRKYLRIDSSFIHKYLLMKTRNRAKLNKVVEFSINTLNAHSIIAFIFNTVIFLSRKGSFPKSVEDGLHIKQVNTFGKEVDTLWERIHDQFGMIVKRDSEYLNWKFINQPNIDYILFEAFRENQCVGYIVIRKGKSPEPNVGFIIDFLADKNDLSIFQSLISHAITYFGKNVNMIECALSVNEWRNTLKKMGFIPREKYSPMFYCDDSIPEKEYAYSCKEFFLTKGDHDLDQFPLPKYC